MLSNVPAESPKKCCIRNLYYPFLDSVILQLDQRFSAHAEAVMRLTSLLLATVVTANFREIEPAVNLFLLSLQGATDKNQSSVPAVAKILSKSFWCCGLEKGLQTLPTGYFSCNKITTQYSRNTSNIFCYWRTIVFYATTDKIKFINNYGSSSFGRSVPMYIHNDISISTGANIEKFAVTSRKIKL